jgi:pimeloyl-ACP methyl ester carboxylesterase
MGQIAYDRVGSGEPLVLIHALGARRQIWAPLIERLAGEREVVAIDQPGFGESPVDKAGVDLTVADRAARLQEFFAELDLQRPHVAGNSIGGAIALELGRAGAARSVTAFAPVGFWGRTGKWWCKAALRGGDWAARHSPPPEALPLPWVRLNLFLYAFGRPFAPPAEQVLVTAGGSRSSPGFQGAVESGLEYEFADPGELTAIPITIAWGRRDVLCTYWTQSRRARQLLPNARHVTIPRGGHIPFFDVPDLCAEILLRNSS